jgi:predicted O-linked N-acetylglucosamine transferase (SPINDLY family)
MFYNVLGFLCEEVTVSAGQFSEFSAEIEGLIASGRWGEVLRRCTEFVGEEPDCAKAWHWAGIAHGRQGAHAEALVAFDEALRLEPDNGLLLYNRGTSLGQAGEVGEALSVLSRAVGLEPHYAPLRCNYGALLSQIGESAKAIEQLEVALQLNPEYAEAYNNAGNALRDQGRIDEAVRMYQEALGLRRDYNVAHSNLLLCLCYQSRFGPERVLAEHLRWGARFAKVPPMDLADHKPGDVLRIGYVSADFRMHSVAFFVEPVIERHDRSRFEIFCYSDGEREDAVTRRLQGAADHWRTISGLDDQQSAGLIAADQIDLLVDLGGHTAHNRLSMFALRPAPVQVTWLGYPNTTGMSQVDYRLVDQWTDPPELAGHSLETLEYLKTGFLAYRPGTNTPLVGALPAKASGRFTLGSFNLVPKLNPGVIAAWAAILQEVPSACLLLKAKEWRDGPTAERYLRMFEAQGVERDRIQLLPFVSSYQEHLELYRQIDLALDPYPYNGTTTTCEALWMGVPTLTLKGDRHCGRVGTSINTRVGLSEFIAQDEASYIAKAVEWSTRLPELAELRSTLRPRVAQSALCDEVGFTRALEETFMSMAKAGRAR